jgi:hypothetical protein
MVLFAKLYRRMREGLAAKHVQHGQVGWQLAKGQRLTARIEADLEGQAFVAEIERHSA